MFRVWNWVRFFISKWRMINLLTTILFYLSNRNLHECFGHGVWSNCGFPGDGQFCPRHGQHWSTTCTVRRRNWMIDSFNLKMGFDRPCSSIKSDIRWSRSWIWWLLTCWIHFNKYFWAAVPLQLPFNTVPVQWFPSKCWSDAVKYYHILWFLEKSVWDEVSLSWLGFPLNHNEDPFLSLFRS